MIKPSVYSERETHVKNEKYLFISYSHKDAEVVYPFLISLYDKGLNFWYDRELNNGEDWSSEAKEAMSNENCIGVIFFLSTNSLSKSIGEEVEFAKKRVEQNNNFFVEPILINAGNYYQIIQKRFIELDGRPLPELEEKLPAKLVCNFLEFFFEKRSFIKIETPSVENDLIEALKKRSLELFSTSNEVITTLEKDRLVRRVGDGYEISFSMFPTNKTTDATFFSEFFKTTDGAWFYRLKQNGIKNYYCMEDIKWTVISVTNKCITALSNICFLYCYYSSIEGETENIKRIVATNSRDVTYQLRFPSFDELKKNSTKIRNATDNDYAVKDAQGIEFDRSGFWADSENGLIVVNNNCNILDKNKMSIAALRLVLEIDRENLEKYVKGD